MTRVVQAEPPGKREARMARVRALLEGRLGGVIRETNPRVSNPRRAARNSQRNRALTS
jgi:hypothetical protein